MRCIDPKRAQYEAFEFVLGTPGTVRITNGAYGNEAEDNSYRVTVADGVPVACKYKVDEYREGACKHRMAVAIRTPIVDVANTQPVQADSGAILEEKPEAAFTYHTEPAEQGGKEYVRCEGCGSELLTELGERDSLPHAEECPNYDRAGDRRRD